MARGALAALLVGVIATMALSAWIPVVETIAGALSLAAFAFALMLARKTTRILALVLAALGIAALLAGVWIGARPSLESLLSVNQAIVGMLATVSFIRLLIRNPREDGGAVRGWRGVWVTAGAVHAMGAALNLGAVNIVGDHLTRRGRLSTFDANILCAAFCSGAFWSPLWAASAVALTYSPEAKPAVLLVTGAALALLTSVPAVAFLAVRHRKELPDYEGYGVSGQLLRVPFTLVALVLVLHALMPAVDVPVVVILSVSALCAVVLLIVAPRQAGPMVGRHAITELPRLAGEVSLFVAAGIAGVGAGALLRQVALPLGELTFGVPLAWAIVVAMVGLGLVGVHPAISIAALATLIAPLDPDNTLMALASLIGWGAAAAIGPASGLNVYLVGRYRADGPRVLRGNVPFVILVVTLAYPALWVTSAIA